MKKHTKNNTNEHRVTKNDHEVETNLGPGVNTKQIIYKETNVNLCFGENIHFDM